MVFFYYFKDTDLVRIYLLEEESSEKKTIYKVLKIILNKF